MKRIIAVIGIILSMILQYHSINDFDAANSGLQVFKALFWLIAGTAALFSFIDDFKNNKWPI